MRKPGRAVAEPAPKPAEVAVENTFARVLAHNDVKIRNKGVKKLKAWLSERKKPHGRLDMMKLWKGLFYCMWMSDKPLVQEDLAKKLGELVHSFPRDEGAVLFIDTFFETILREWHGIDRLRLDKYYFLVSQVVKQGIARVIMGGEDSEMLGPFTEVLRKGPLAASDEVVRPLGILFHLCDAHLGLVNEATDSQGLPPSLYFNLLLPYLEVLAGPAPAVAQARVVSGVVDKLLEHAFPSPDAEVAVDLGEQEIDWEGLAQWMFARGSDPSTADAAREALYTTRRKILNRRSKHAKHQAAIEAGGMEAEVDERPTLVRKRPSEDYAPPELAEGFVSARALKRRRRRAEQKAAAANGGLSDTPNGNGVARADSEEDPSASGKKKKKTKAKKAEVEAAEAASPEPTPAPAIATPTSVKTPPNRPVTRAKSAAKSKGERAEPEPTPVRKVRKSVGGAAGKTPKAAGTKGGKLAAATASAGSKVSSESEVATPPAVERVIKGILRAPATPPSGQSISWGTPKMRRFKKKLPPSSVSKPRKSRRDE